MQPTGGEAREHRDTETEFRRRRSQTEFGHEIKAMHNQRRPLS